MKKLGWAFLGWAVSNRMALSNKKKIKERFIFALTFRAPGEQTRAQTD